MAFIGFKPGSLESTASWCPTPWATQLYTLDQAWRLSEVDNSCQLFNFIALEISLNCHWMPGLTVILSATGKLGALTFNARHKKKHFLISSFRQLFWNISFIAKFILESKAKRPLKTTTIFFLVQSKQAKIEFLMKRWTLKMAAFEIKALKLTQEKKGSLFCSYKLDIWIMVTWLYESL